ncbi:hypothetical protein HAX54_011633 [Datura stramonium]|uniref:Uncharacterized protein n=1 Tax=Datura stramonium TaxID=4076 RepID=A0ABS8TK16_DATST|nr:hypothetical protein [Datura stramonium]
MGRNKHRDYSKIAPSVGPNVVDCIEKDYNSKPQFNDEGSIAGGCVLVELNKLDLAVESSLVISKFEQNVLI